MRKVITSGLALFFTVGITSLSACAQESEKSIEGKWRLDGELPKTGSGRGMSWFLEWTFADGKFL
ncbi:MAG: hypothetical protein ACR2F2_05085 [Pyrinomonadaceae bacterium]